MAAIYQETGHPDWAKVEDDRERLLPPLDCASEKSACDFLAGRFSQLVMVARKSPNPESYYWQARAYLRLGQAEDAVPHLKAALDIDETGSFYYQLARAYEKTGQTVLAKQNLQKFEEISKSVRVRRQKFFEERQIAPS